MDSNLAKEIEFEGDWDGEVRVDHEYSGRGMYGEETSAIIVYSDIDASEATVRAAKRGVKLKWDALGLNGTILF